MVRSVVERAPCSVLVAPRAARMWSAGVLVASDPDATDMTPVSTAAAIAAECALPLAIVAVCDATPPAIQRAEAALARAAAAARAFAVEPVMLLRHGRAHEQIIDAARERGADLIVVGRRGDESLAHAWLGGTAQKTVGLAAHAVLVAINPSAQHSPHP
jgi:nucleotide-binding universal stress UspA family protein